MYDQNLIKDDQLLKKCSGIWNKISNIMEKPFDSQPLLEEKYLSAKVTSSAGKINTDFHDKKYPKRFLIACVYQ